MTLDQLRRLIFETGERMRQAPEHIELEYSSTLRTLAANIGASRMRLDHGHVRKHERAEARRISDAAQSLYRDLERARKQAMEVAAA